MNLNDDLNNEDEIVDQGEASQEVDNSQASKTYTEQEVEEMKAQLEKDFETKFDDKFNKRWGREMSKREQEDAEKNELVNLLKSQTGKENVKDLLDLSYEQYGVQRPITSSTNKKDDEILGKYDAKEILELDDEEIEEEANRLAGIKRNAREEATFLELGNYLTSKKLDAKRKQEIKEAGIDEDTLNNEDFKNFMSKFNENTSLKDIYEIFSKTNNVTPTVKQKPFSAGSLKDKKFKEESEFFTEEEFNSLTAKDLENPKIYEKAMKSRLLFK